MHNMSSLSKRQKRRLKSDVARKMVENEVKKKKLLTTEQERSLQTECETSGSNMSLGCDASVEPLFLDARSEEGHLISSSEDHVVLELVMKLVKSQSQIFLSVILS